jgi:hypothetical protein
MNDEKMKILQMVEDNKITVEDAIKLLDALKHRPQRFNGGDSDFEKKVGKFVGNVDGFAKEFGGNMVQKFKEMEPTLRKATKAVVEKTAKIVNDISNALNDSVKGFENKEDEGCCCHADDCCEGELPADDKCGCGCDDEPKEN